MSEQTGVPENEAIRQIIAEGGAMDYVDVVDAVKKRFRVDTTAAQVEQIHQEMMRAQRTSHQSPPASVKLELASKLPPETANAATGASLSGSGSEDAHVAEALKFVNNVGGLSHARVALKRLEQLLQS